MWIVQGNEEHKLGHTRPQDCCSSVLRPVLVLPAKLARALRSCVQIILAVIGAQLRFTSKIERPFLFYMHYFHILFPRLNPTLTVAKANRFGVFYNCSDCLIRSKNSQGPTIIIPDARLKVKIQNPRYNTKDARCKTIPGTRYVSDTILRSIPGTSKYVVICNRYITPGT